MFVGQKPYKYVSSFRIYAACTINSKYAFFAVETSKNSVVVRLPVIRSFQRIAEMYAYLLAQGPVDDL